MPANGSIAPDAWREVAERLPSVRTTVVIPHLIRRRMRRCRPDRATSLRLLVHPVPAGASSRACRLRAAVRPVLVGHHRRPQMHRPSARPHAVQHQKEQLLHCDLLAADRCFFFTTCGWMMWNWFVSGLATGATFCFMTALPFIPTLGALCDIADGENRPFRHQPGKFIEFAKRQGRRCKHRTHDLSTVRMICPRGRRCPPESFALRL